MDTNYLIKFRKSMNDFFDDFGYSVKREGYGGNSLWIYYGRKDGSTIESVIFAERSRQTGFIDFSRLMVCIARSKNGTRTDIKRNIDAGMDPPAKVLTQVLETSVAGHFYRLPKCD